MFGGFDSHASVLIPVEVSRHSVQHPTRCQRLTSISGNIDNGHHAMLHTCGSAPGMSIRGSHRTKGCFSGCAGHNSAAQSALVLPRAVHVAHTALCDGRRCPPRDGPRGVNSGYGHPVLPKWTVDTSGVPWCHRGTPASHTMVQCNHSQSEGIHEFIPALGIRKQTVHYLSAFPEVNLFQGNHFQTLFGLLNMLSFGILLCENSM